MNQRLKKGVSVLLAAMLAACCMSGCTPKEKEDSVSEAIGETTTTEVADETGKELSVVFSMTQNDESLMNTYEQILELYKEKTGVTVKAEYLQESDTRTYIVTRQSAGNAPDVYFAKLADAWADYAKGCTIDLTQYLNEESPYMPGKAWKDTFTPVLMEQAADPQGNIPGVPWSVSGIRIIYNMDILNAAGVEEIPVTIDEFFDTCEKVKETGIIPIGLPNSKTNDAAVNWWGQNFTAQLDKKLRDQMDFDGNGMIQVNELVRASDDGLIDFNASPLKDALAVMEKMIPYCNSDSSSTSRTDVFDMWLRGDVAMMAFGSGDSSLVKAMEDITCNYEMGSFPVLPKESYPDSTEKPINHGGRLNALFTVSKTGDAEKEKQAVDFVQYFMSTEPQTMLAQNNYVIPPLTDIDLPGDLQWWLTADNEDILRANYFGAATSKQFADFTSMSSQLLFSNSISLDEWCNELNTEWKSCIEKLKEENGWSADNNYGSE